MIKGKKVTLADVAQEAGVSRKTVSRVINREAHVSKCLHDRVQKVIDALNYTPDPKARGLRSSRSYNIAFAYEYPASSYVITMIEGIRQACRENGYEVVIIETEAQRSNLVNSILDMVKHARPDGLILMPPLADDEQLLDTLEQSDVLYGRVAPGTALTRDGDVTTTEHDAGAEMMQHLLDLGHRHIGYISGDPEHLLMAQRLVGAQSVIKNWSGEPCTLTVEQGMNTFDSGRDAAAILLGRSPTPTAIFSANDDMASGVIFEAHERGLKIPDDISVVGFDDTMMASRIWPGLTTVHQPVKAMGKLATTLLIERIMGKCPEPAKPLPTQTIYRRSSGPVPLK